MASAMASVEKSVEVRVPVHTAYIQWTQFEDFPRFMQGVHEVRQLDDTHLQWCAEIGGKTTEWHAVITEQVPDQRIAWINTSGAHNAGVVTFHRVDTHVTKVILQVDYEPEGAMHSVGSSMGMVGRRIEGDLERFKEIIEACGFDRDVWCDEMGQSH